MILNVLMCTWIPPKSRRLQILMLCRRWQAHPLAVLLTMEFQSPNLHQLHIAKQVTSHVAAQFRAASMGQWLGPSPIAAVLVKQDGLAMLVTLIVPNASSTLIQLFLASTWETNAWLRIISFQGNLS